MNTRNASIKRNLTALPLIVSGVLSACTNVLAKPPGVGTLQIPNGVAVGDVGADRAVIWARADREAEMHVHLAAKQVRDSGYRTRVSAEEDYTGKILLNGLEPETSYRFTVTFRDRKAGHPDRSETLHGRFTTAPSEDVGAPVRFAWGGDLAGQNVCRDRVQGFPIFEIINQSAWDFFIGLGDMIYADGLCEDVGGFGNLQIPGNFVQSADLANFWAHWSYNREDPGLQRLLANTPYVAIWDDHEVVNDFGPLHDTRDTPPYTPGVHLLPIGLKAFLDYNPIVVSPETPKRLYRTIRWGQHVELFILDTRQYRDANFQPDDPNAPKSMLGREQCTWLKEKLATSDATWKVIVSSVPLSIPTGFPPTAGRDGWANFDQNDGFENEVLDILRFMQQQGIQNNVWLTTDVHFAEGFRYQPFSDAPEFEVYEFVSGPLNAGVFPNTDFDVSLNPSRLFFYGAPNGLDFQGALDYFTFGAVEVSSSGDMTVQIINANGTVVAEELLPRK